MLSVLVFRNSEAVLVFLHGVGEGFRNSVTGAVGLKNLFRQGIPKALYDPGALLPAGHPLTTGTFTVVAPQLPDRDTPWNLPEHVLQIRQAVASVGGQAEPKVYVVGFSKGGQAAFQMAGELKCRAIVSIDASPMAQDPDTAAKEIAQCKLPFWSIHTSYPAGHKLEKIPNMHKAIDVPEHAVADWDQVAPPEAGARCKSVVLLEEVDAGSRHVELCTRVTKSPAPYEWLLNH